MPLAPKAGEQLARTPALMGSHPSELGSSVPSEGASSAAALGDPR